jgi:hypothetical protein
MSPNSYLAFNDDGLLCGYQGECEGEDPVFTWTYTEFEAFLDEAVTPSMYNYMACYVEENFTKEELYEIQGGDYATGPLEAEAVDAYFALPIRERIRLHEQELVNLRANKRDAEARESAAIDAMLEENRPFDESSPIARDYVECMRGIIDRERDAVDRLEREIHEEEQWRAGHEEGAENDDHLAAYDHMEEF